MQAPLTIGQHAVAAGGFSDIWKATNENGDLFAIKVFRLYESNVVQVKKVGRFAFLPLEDFSPGFGIPEILQRGCPIQVDETPERLADRGRRSGSVPVLYGIQVDGEREHAGVSKPVSSPH